MVKATPYRARRGHDANCPHEGYKIRRLACAGLYLGSLQALAHAEKEGFTHIISVNTHLELSPATYSDLVGQAVVLVGTCSGPCHPVILVSPACRISLIRIPTGGRAFAWARGDRLMEGRRHAGPDYEAFLSTVGLSAGKPTN